VTETRKRYCSNCGAELDPRARVCPKCGIEQAPLAEKVSNVWYLAPFFLGIIGGLIAWLANKDRDPKKARNFLIFGLVWSIVLMVLIWFAAVAFLAALFHPLTSQEIQKVVIKVEYDGEWQGAYGDVYGIVSWNGNGAKTVTLDRASDAYLWIVSANAQKKDNSNGILTIKILKMDGTILKQASTSSPYGMAQVAININ